MVVCHGLQGKRTDVDRLAMCLQFYNPSLHVLTSKSLESDSSCEIYLSALRLAEEIKDYIAA